MKITCDIIKDLMIIYNEEVSGDTKRLVEEHLETCEECREYYRQINESLDSINDIKVMETDTKEKNKAVKKSFSKIRNRWIASVLIVILLVPIVAFCGRLTVNQIDGRGLKYTNIDEVLLCKKYLQNIEKKDFDKLYGTMDIEARYEDLKEIYDSYVSKEGIREFEDIKLNGSDWKVIGDKKDILAYEGDELSFWSNAIENNMQNIMIPEAVWNQVVTNPTVTETDYFNQDIVFYYPQENTVWEDEGIIDIYENPGFVRLETKWGNYYVFGKLTYDTDEDKVYVPADVMLDNCTSDDYCVNLYRWMNILPKEIEEDAVKIVEASIDEGLNSFNEEYGDIINMNAKEYVGHMKDSYKKGFESFWNAGYSITDISYIDKDQIERIAAPGETYTMHVEVKNREGNVSVGKFVFTVRDDKIECHMSEGSGDGVDALYNAITN
ncbi:MAG: zf-HC2 domain-containing protein [Lachnospiraceae bacterium]|nr:zf-HC2 domain-containing protein [Lachnospiraceae bacterium]